MRSWASLFILFSITMGAQADRLISTPTARKLPNDTVRVEYAFENKTARTQFAYLAAGIGPFFEVEAHTQKLQDQNTFGTVDVAYNYIAPIPGISPGFSAGVQDLANTTEDGRRVYLCTTFREPVLTASGMLSADVTLGVYLQGRRTGFVGVALPFGDDLKMLTEHDGQRISFGFELRPIKPLGLRLLFRERDTLFSTSWTTRF